MRRLMVRHASVAAVVLLMASCQPLSKHPLVKPEEALQDKRMYGVWVSVPAKDNKEKDGVILTIGPSSIPLHPDAKQPEQGAMQAWYQAYTAKTAQFDNPIGFYFVAGPIKNTWVASVSEGMNMTVVDKPRDNDPTKLISGRDNRFWFLRYEIEGELLKFWQTPDLDVVDKAITAGKLHGKVTRNNQGKIESIDLTDSTEELQRFFNEALAVLFPKEPAEVFRRADILPK